MARGVAWSEDILAVLKSWILSINADIYPIASLVEPRRLSPMRSGSSLAVTWGKGNNKEPFLFWYFTSTHELVLVVSIKLTTQIKCSWEHQAYQKREQRVLKRQRTPAAFRATQHSLFWLVYLEMKHSPPHTATNKKSNTDFRFRFRVIGTGNQTERALRVRSRLKSQWEHREHQVCIGCAALVITILVGTVVKWKWVTRVYLWSVTSSVESKIGIVWERELCDVTGALWSVLNLWNI